MEGYFTDMFCIELSLVKALFYSTISLSAPLKGSGLPVCTKVMIFIGKYIAYTTEYTLRTHECCNYNTVSRRMTHMYAVFYPKPVFYHLGSLCILYRHPCLDNMTVLQLYFGNSLIFYNLNLSVYIYRSVYLILPFFNCL